jgi:hypothetical protein
LSSSDLCEKNRVGNYYELEGKDERIWRLYSAVDKNDMMGMPHTIDDVNKLALFWDLESAGYKLKFNGYIPLPFVSFPLVAESPQGVVSETNCLWCYCVKCGGMLAGKSVMALQIMVGIKEITMTTKVYARSENRYKKKKKKKGKGKRGKGNNTNRVFKHVPHTNTYTRNTYLPRLLCSKCCEPAPSHTMYPLVALCFESLDHRLFNLMSKYEKNYPLDKTLKYVQAEEYKQSQKKYCQMCGLSCKRLFCSEECEECHVLLVKLKKDMKVGEDQIHEDDEAIKQKVPTKEFSEIIEDYVKDMLSYFKRERLNVNKRLRPMKCQNPLCKKQAKGGRIKDLDCCSRCNRASYCSKECQTAHFSQHKVTCSYWKDIWNVDNLVTLAVTKKHVQ